MWILDLITLICCLWERHFMLGYEDGNRLIENEFGKYQYDTIDFAVKK